MYVIVNYSSLMVIFSAGYREIWVLGSHQKKTLLNYTIQPLARQFLIAI
jgi:hypothetical protein